MATKTILTYTDDLDGSDANGTVKFGLDGTDYEIDLNEVNETKLRDALASFVAAARKVKAKRGRKPGGGSTGAAGGASTGDVAAKRERNQAIREWALANDWEVSKRGRLAREIVEAYENANSAAA